jgi:hypothetical protein
MKHKLARHLATLSSKDAIPDQQALSRFVIDRLTDGTALVLSPSRAIVKRDGRPGVAICLGTIAIDRITAGTS